MEARQLCYFLMACQQPNHATAAKELGVAPSTLSTSLNLLEEELGIQLFRRTQQGFYPTKEARWLYSEAELILRTMESAHSYLGSVSDLALHEISITSSLKFFLGRLSRVLSASIGQMQKCHPEVLFTVNFQLGLEEALGKLVAQSDAAGTDPANHSIHIDYLSSDAFEDKATEPFVSIFEDSWVVVTNSPVFPLEEEELPALSVEDIKGLNLNLPLLPDQLLADALGYCKAHGIPLPSRSEEDIGSLPRLSQTVESFSFLLPKSALSSRLGQRRLFIYPLETPLISHLVAHIRTDLFAAKELVADFSKRILHSEEVHPFRPQFTLRQISYFQEVFNTCNISLAAQRLRVAQPALSSQIRKLEASLESPLFDRERSGLKPTQAGRIFAAYAGLINDALNRIRRDVVGISAKRQSRLRLGIIPLADDSTPLASALASSLIEWRKQYPDVVVQVFEGPSDVLQDWLQTGTVHLIVLETNSGTGGRLELSRDDEMGLITNPAHGLINGDKAALDLLKELKLVLPTHVLGIRRLIDNFLAGKVPLSIEMECNSLATTLELVRQAPLATILPMAAVERGIKNGDLTFTPFTQSGLQRKLYVGFSNERELTKIERDFTALLRSHMGYVL